MVNFLIIRGIKIVTTGRLSAREEAQLTEYTEKGARTYKLVNAVINILAGLILFAIAAINILRYQNIIEDTNIFKIIFAAVVVILVVILIIARNKCRTL